MHNSHREESGVGVEGIGEPEAELGSEVCRVPGWYLHTSGMLLMQNSEHHVLSIGTAVNACKPWGCMLPSWMAEGVDDLQGHWQNGNVQIISGTKPKNCQSSSGKL